MSIFSKVSHRYLIEVLNTKDKQGKENRKTKFRSSAINPETI